MKVKAAINKLMALAGCGLLATGIGCKPLEFDLTSPNNEVSQVESNEQDNVQVQPFLLIPEGFSGDVAGRIQEIDWMLQECQIIFANEMERHGYGRKTFDLKTNVTILEGHIAKYGYNNHLYDPPDSFHQNINIIFSITHLDNSGWGSHIGYGYWPDIYGIAVISEGAWTHSTVLHELGHAFGLSHDFINDQIDSSHFMGYNFIGEQNKISPEMASQLNNHEAFNHALYDEFPMDFYSIFPGSKKTVNFNNNNLEIKIEVDYINPYKQYLDGYNTAVLVTIEEEYNNQPQEINYTKSITKVVDGDKIIYSIVFESIPDYLETMDGFFIVMKGYNIPIIDNLVIDFTIPF